jgi:hypothetical protein
MRRRSFVKAGEGMLLGYARVSKGDEQSNAVQAKALRAASCRRISMPFGLNRIAQIALTDSGQGRIPRRGNRHINLPKNVLPSCQSEPHFRREVLAGSAAACCDRLRLEGCPRRRGKADE